MKTDLEIAREIMHSLPIDTMLTTGEIELLTEKKIVEALSNRTEECAKLAESKYNSLPGLRYACNIAKAIRNIGKRSVA